jgi:hypothetical protein
LVAEKKRGIKVKVLAIALGLVSLAFPAYAQNMVGMVGGGTGGGHRNSRKTRNSKYRQKKAGR